MLRFFVSHPIGNLLITPLRLFMRSECKRKVCRPGEAVDTITTPLLPVGEDDKLLTLTAS